MPLPQTEDKTELRPEGEGGDLSPKHIEAINATVAAQLKRALKDAPTRADLDALVEKAMERVSAKAAPEPAKTEPDELAKMRRRMEEMERSNQAAEERAVAAERRARLDRAEGEVHRLLSGGADPKLKVKDDYLAVLSQHFMSQVKLTPEGKALLTVRRPPAKGLAPEEMEVELADGISGWLKSEEAAAWLPPPAAPGPAAKPTAARPLSATPAPRAGTSPAAPRPADSLDDAIARTVQQLAEMGVDASRL